MINDMDDTRDAIKYMLENKMVQDHKRFVNELKHACSMIGKYGTKLAHPTPPQKNAIKKD